MFFDHILGPNTNSQVWAVISGSSEQRTWTSQIHSGISSRVTRAQVFTIFIIISYSIYPYPFNLEVPVTWWVSLCRPVTVLRIPLEEDTLRLLPSPAATNMLFFLGKNGQWEENMRNIDNQWGLKRRMGISQNWSYWIIGWREEKHTRNLNQQECGIFMHFRQAKGSKTRQNHDFEDKKIIRHLGHKAWHRRELGDWEMNYGVVYLHGKRIETHVLYDLYAIVYSYILNNNI